MSTINSEEWLAELDRVCVDIPRPSGVITDRGWTLQDLMEHKGISRQVATIAVKAMEKEGQVKCIGKRPGRNGAKVYEMTELA